MNLHAIYHEPKSRYSYAADSFTLHIRLRAAAGDIQGIKLVAADPFSRFPDHNNSHTFDAESVIETEMRREYRDGLFDYWFCEIRSPTRRTRYAFVLDDGQNRLCYGSSGFFGAPARIPEDIDRFFNFPDICDEDIYRAPEWVSGTVWYQIFPDAWGSLRSITGGLSYIAGLGFNGIYLTPIFTSPSKHKYNTTDYFQIDPAFGTNEDFRELVRTAHGLGIRVMLDAVFNHAGFSHPFFQDVVEKGKDSEYFDWFHILREPVLNFETVNGNPPELGREQMKNLPYRAFAFVAHMPKWNTANPAARTYLLNIARHWAEEYGIDGWRFDVSNEVSHDFWRETRKFLKALKPDIFLLGENWDDSMPWLCGDQFDSVMNYGLLDAVTGFCGVNPNGESLDAPGFRERVTRKVLAAYPKPVQRVLFNMLDSHDTDRLITFCGGNIDAAKLAYVIQMTMGGAPSIYYGGEAGMDGMLRGNENRLCMVWDVSPEKDLRDFLKRLIALRKRHPSMREADVEFLQCEGGFLFYRKRAEGETLLVAVNRDHKSRSVELPASPGGYTDAMTGEAVTGGHITLPGYGFALLLH